MFELFEKGGIVMGIILCLSIYVTAAILFKAYQCWKLRILDTVFLDFIFRHLGQKNLKRALAEAGASPHPLARVAESSLLAVADTATALDKSKEEIERVGSAQIRYLESHLRGLELVANIAPLLGLLGTVIGMVAAFSTLEQAGSRVDPSLLAGGIWTALLTTVAGLSVAIPAIAAHYILDGMIEKIRGQMKDVVVRILSLHGQLLLREEKPSPASMTRAELEKLVPTF